MSAPATTTKRMPRWTGAMIGALVEGMYLHSSVLGAKFSSTITATRKADAWRSITSHVNSMNETEERRDVEKVCGS